MHKIIALLIASICFVGCQQQTKDSNYHDPLLRQQLTTMLSNLNGDTSAPQAINDLNSILTVNESKLSDEQKDKLTSARDKLQDLQRNLDDFQIMQTKPDYTEAKGDENAREGEALLDEAKNLIGEVAATF
jgi:uncharacterized protein HemX